MVPALLSVEVLVSDAECTLEDLLDRQMENKAVVVTGEYKTLEEAHDKLHEVTGPGKHGYALACCRSNDRVSDKEVSMTWTYKVLYEYHNETSPRE